MFEGIIEVGCSERHSSMTVAKKKIVICLTGLTSCGKSTLAKRLAKKYGLKYVSGSVALKTLAFEAGYKPTVRGWWTTGEGLNFHQLRAKDPRFDEKVDKRLLKWAKLGNVVIDSWTIPWLLQNGFKIWLEVSQEERARRLMRRESRMSFEEALMVLKEKDERSKAIYKKYYGFDLGEDFSPFDVVLDTNILSANETFDVLCLVIDRLYFKKHSGQDTG